MDPQQKRRWLFVLAYSIFGLALLILVANIAGFVFEDGKIQLGGVGGLMLMGVILLSQLNREQK